MKIWITKYALAQGILEKEGNLFMDDPILACVLAHDNLITAYYHQKEWHTTREEAVIEANRMKEKRLVQLKKQIIRLEKLTFE